MFHLRSNGCIKTGVGYHFKRSKSDKLSAKNVRQHFINYFKKEAHLFVPSSSVKPFSDPTLGFVNAGMNQFKNIFLGITSPPSAKVTNSQKCIRIGGKHNDLNSVGFDTYHHTFFEMLGNWSFGDYFKKDACKYAWDLLTSNPYSLHPSRLYVTYFNGDDKMSLPPDLETKEIWREIGVEKNRILPFTTKDNFWEMSSTGPCGPCTEIHYDHIGRNSRSHLVNSNSTDLTELWNLVFIQYNKLEDGSLMPLKQNFVDTGMGFERLLAILQGKLSNYDTDLFIPLFNEISRYGNIEKYKGLFGVDDKNGKDTQYRILADHARMVAVAIADNIFPDESQGLRRVIRKSLMTAEDIVPGRGVHLFQELIKLVGEMLGTAYPEILVNAKQIDYVTKRELEVWKQIQSTVKAEWKKVLEKNSQYKSLHDVQSIGLISAIKELDKAKLPPGSVLNPELALILHDRYGLTPQIIDELAAINGYHVDGPKLEIDIIKLKEKNKSELYSLSNLNLSKETLFDIGNLFEKTDDSYKYYYTRNETGHYHFNELQAKVLCLLSSGEILKKEYSLKRGSRVGVILDRTNFWASLKESDQGNIHLVDKEGKAIGVIKIENARHHGAYIIHNGIFLSEEDNYPLDELSAIIKLDSERRLTLMRNNMASHLLTNAIKSKFVVNAQSFANSGHDFSVKYSFYDHISEGDMMLMEHTINLMINKGFDIKCSIVDSKEMFTLLNTLSVPSYINVLTNIAVLDYKYGPQSSREITTGPVVYNSKDIGELCLVGIELNKKKKECVLKVLTGERVNLAYTESNKFIDIVNGIPLDQADVRNLEELLLKGKRLVNKNLVPMSLRIEINNLMNQLTNAIKETQLKNKIALLENAINTARNNNLPFVVHYSEDLKLEKLTRLCQDLPVMLFTYYNGYLASRCTVPENSRLSAETWMIKVTEKIGGHVCHIKGQNSTHVCGMKPLKLNKPALLNVVQDAKNCAELIACEYLSIKE